MHVWIDGSAPVAQLEMEMGARRVARGPCPAQCLSLTDLLADSDRYFGQMGVVGAPAVLMFQDHQIAVATAPFCKDDLSVG